MLAQLKAAVALNPTAGPEQQKAIWEGIGSAIVEHIQAMAQISGVIVTVSSVSLVTPGVAASGPGAGTGMAPPGSIS